MFSTTTLKNGLKIITHEHHDSNIIYIEVSVSGGSKYSPQGKEGLAHFVEHMVMNGTRKYPSGLDIRRAVENLGGKSNAVTSKESASFWVKVLHEDLDQAAEILFPLVVSPLLSKSELTGERKIILEELSREQDRLERKVNNSLFKLVFGGHPLAHPVLGYSETISKIKHEDIASFVKDFYVPKNMVVAVAGKLSHESFVALIEDYFFDFENYRPPVYSEFSYRQFGPRAVVLIEDSKQANLIMSFPSFPRNLRDHLIEKVMSYLMSSHDRLFARLREKEKLAYTVEMYRPRFKDLSLISVHGGFTYSEVSRAVSTICEELKKIKEEEISPEELRKIKKLIEVDLLFDLEKPSKWVEFVLEWNHFLGDPIEPQQFLDELAKVSADEIRELAQKIFVPDNAYLSVSHRDITSEELEEILLKGLSA